MSSRSTWRATVRIGGRTATSSRSVLNPTCILEGYQISLIDIDVHSYRSGSKASDRSSSIRSGGKDGRSNKKRGNTLSLASILFDCVLTISFIQ